MIVNITNIIQAPAHHANYTSRQVQLVVIHVSAGTEQSLINTFQNPASQVSAHYSVSRVGQAYQHVSESDIAWHAGIKPPCVWVAENKNLRPGINPNVYSIGIEHEGQSHEPWPDNQIRTSARLVADVCRRNGIPVDRAHIVGHHEIYAGHDCPGSGCPLDVIVAMASKL